MNQLAAFMCEPDKLQRLAIIRRARFLSDHTATEDQELRAKLQCLTSQPSVRGQELDKWIMKLENQIRNDSEKDAALLRNNLSIAQTYRGIFARRFSKYDFGSPAVISNRISGVSVEACLDSMVIGDYETGTYAGGMMMLTLPPGHIRCIRSYYRKLTALIYCILVKDCERIAPHLCIVVDLTAAMVTRAPSSNQKFKRRAIIACEEIYSIWRRYDTLKKLPKNIF
ncbi:hypothetical protein [Gymnodinialimonas ulvae]|uniref:hypothetical protein n=1 Tax=Gymnodinialimonas ulvae TaxID=3126504 RepID=UPI0030EF660F